VQEVGVGGALLEDDNEVERELKAQVPHHPELVEDVVVVVVHLDLGLGEQLPRVLLSALQMSVRVSSTAAAARSGLRVRVRGVRG